MEIQLSFAREVDAALHHVLGADLVATWLAGSAAAGDFEPATSDADVQGVVAGPLSAQRRRAVADAVLPLARRAPARGLELVLYALPLDPDRRPRYEVNVNAGPRMPERVDVTQDEVDLHWFVLDLGIARELARPLRGPPPAEIVPAYTRPLLLEALRESLDWHATNESAEPNAVLGACRAWLYAAEGHWASKSEAAAWALDRAADPDLVEAALAARRDGSRRLDARRVDLMLEQVRAELDRAV